MGMVDMFTFIMNRGWFTGDVMCWNLEGWVSRYGDGFLKVQIVVEG